MRLATVGLSRIDFCRARLRLDDDDQDEQVASNASGSVAVTVDSPTSGAVIAGRQRDRAGHCLPSNASVQVQGKPAGSRKWRLHWAGEPACGKTGLTSSAARQARPRVHERSSRGSRAANPVRIGLRRGPAPTPNPSQPSSSSRRPLLLRWRTLGRAKHLVCLCG